MTTEKMSVEQALECLEHSAGIVERQALATLRAELEGMKADAERGCWLIDRLYVTDGTLVTIRPFRAPSIRGIGWPGPDDFRTALDRAREVSP